ncbi:unnamed protein product, partial [Laminaria digitata]
NRQNVARELESKFLKIATETFCMTQEALVTTSISLGQDPDNYVRQLTRLQNLLSEIEAPVSDRHFTDIALQGITEEYRNV